MRDKSTQAEESEFFEVVVLGAGTAFLPRLLRHFLNVGELHRRRGFDHCT